MTTQQVELIEKQTPFQGYFRVDKFHFRHTLFAGGWSPPIAREVFERGHAVALLPYDPVRDEVVLIEQFRIGPYAHGENGWLIEIVAGIIDAGEDKLDVVHRELREEAGLALSGPLEPICRYYTSPGCCTETIQMYCGRVDASRAAGIHGLPDEGEDIRVLTMPSDEAFRAVADGRINSSPPIIALQWLALNREALRARWLKG